MSEINPNEIAASVISDITKDFVKSLTGTMKKNLSKGYSKIFEDFSSYLDVSFRRCSSVRTIVNRDKSYKIEELYVSGNFSSDGKKHTDNDLIDGIRAGVPTVVLGFGGVGKTVFSKYIWMSIFNNPYGKVPVFFELRQLNNLTSADLTTAIRSSLGSGKGIVDAEIFHDLAMDGRFVFILDGFDEVPDTKKQSVENQILKLTEIYSSCGFVVSSRHDARFSAWQLYTTYKALPFSKEQVLELLSKVEFEQSSKKKFVKEIIEKRYSEYKSFLSTPLLSLMMLMTFHQFAEVPEKRHIFYRYAFLTLYSWHDSSKEAFKRESKTGLVVDQFEKIFSIFCFLTYIRFDFTFDDLKIRNSLEKAKQYVEFEFDTGKLISEITESVNLMYKDGESYAFTHRSFQEYFCAFALNNYFSNRMLDIVPRIHVNSDSVLPLMYEMNRDIVEEQFIIPTYQSISQDVSIISKLRSSDKILNILGTAVVEVYSRLSKENEIRGGSEAGTIYSNISGVIHNNAIHPKLVQIKKIFSAQFDSEIGTDSLYMHSEAYFISQAKAVFDTISDGNDTDEITFVYINEDKGVYFKVGSFDTVDIRNFEEIRGAWQFIEFGDSRLNKDLQRLSQSLKAMCVFSSQRFNSVKKRIDGKNLNIDDLL